VPLKLLATVKGSFAKTVTKLKKAITGAKLGIVKEAPFTAAILIMGRRLRIGALLAGHSSGRRKGCWAIMSSRRGGREDFSRNGV